MIGNQPHVEFTVLLHETPARLATEAARRRHISPEVLLAEISSGVLTKGVIERWREQWSDWRLQKRARW
jgi:hypothetical protein